jgi:hypothetical protein
LLSTGERDVTVKRAMVGLEPYAWAGAAKG